MFVSATQIRQATPRNMPSISRWHTWQQHYHLWEMRGVASTCSRRRCVCMRQETQHAANASWGMMRATYESLSWSRGKNRQSHAKRLAFCVHLRLACLSFFAMKLDSLMTVPAYAAAAIQIKVGCLPIRAWRSFACQVVACVCWRGWRSSQFVAHLPKESKKRASKACRCVETSKQYWFSNKSNDAQTCIICSNKRSSNSLRWRIQKFMSYSLKREL